MSRFTRFSWGKIWFERFDLSKKNYISQLCAGILESQSQESGIPMEFGVTPLTQIRDGSIVMSKGVMQLTTVRKVIHWASVILEG